MFPQMSKKRLRRWAGRATLTLLIVGITFVLGPVGAPALANSPPTIISIPGALALPVIANPCDGDLIVSVGGTFQIVEHSTLDASGGTHLIAEGNAQGITATGASGTVYRATGGFWAEVNVSGPPPFNFTVASVFNLLSRGSGDNFVAHEAFHLTIDANGNVTAVVTNVSAECLG